MSNTVDVYFLFKIMPIEYIDNFAKGNFYFSCCGNWVEEINMKVYLPNIKGRTVESQ